jgi:hypothetical protein
MVIVRGAVSAIWIACACGRAGFGTLGDSAGPDQVAPDVPVDAFPTNLVIWFPLDEASGSTSFADIVSHQAGACGTSTRCPTQVAGHLGMAQHFDGASECIVVPDAGQAEPTHLTLSVWMKPDQVAKATIFAKRVVVGTPLNVWQLEVSATGVVTFTYTTGGAEHGVSSAAGVLTANTWHHFAATFDGSTADVYFDGTLKAATPVTQSLTYDTSVFAIGCESNTVFDEWFPGAVDEARVYNRALSAAEIAALAAM